MFWGCFGWKGTGHSYRIDGKMDADLYVDIIEDKLQNSLDHWDFSVDDVTFQQDNDPKHTSKKIKYCFKENKSWSAPLNPLIQPHLRCPQTEACIVQTPNKVNGRIVGESAGRVGGNIRAGV
ncbi:hypothetical protein BD413DRAFT_621559 [Trametes elegans]|nr:hypothetical protein BD413DRAFT_621559 [Trametes elegans]